MKGILKRGVVIGLIAMFGSTACTEEKDDNTGLLLGALLLTQTPPSYFISATIQLRRTTEQSGLTVGGVADTSAWAFRSLTTTPAAVPDSKFDSFTYAGTITDGSHDSIANAARRYASARLIVPTATGTTETPSNVFTSGADATGRFSVGLRVSSITGNTVRLTVRRATTASIQSVVTATVNDAGRSDTDTTRFSNSDSNTTLDAAASYSEDAGTISFDVNSVVSLTGSATFPTITVTGTDFAARFVSLTVTQVGTYNLENPTVAENICDGRSLTGSPTVKTGNITASETWSGGILLQGTVNITGATVTVNPGTVIFGQRGSSIFAYNGGAVVSNGTASAPVCFTSAAVPGTRSPGDWGGIVLIGNGFNTRQSAAQTEGTTPQSYPSTTANSNSRFAYTVIEFAGNEVAPGDELNNLSMYAVDNSGTGPALDRVQTHRGLDDSFEWWGGNISGRFLVATGGLDDDFDADEGYGVSSSGTSSATLTSLIALKYPASCGGSFSTDPHSFEMDGRNSGSSQSCANTSGNLTTASCVTNPTVSSFTIIGQNITGGSGMRLREGMRGDFSNGLIWNFTGPAVECTNNSGFANSGVTVSNLFAGQSGAVTNAGTANCNTVSATLTALPITSLGNVAGDGCGFGATKPDFTTVATANRGAQATENSKWWEGWTVYRAR